MRLKRTEEKGSSVRGKKHIEANDSIQPFIELSALPFFVVCLLFKGIRVATVYWNAIAAVQEVWLDFVVWYKISLVSFFLPWFDIAFIVSLNVKQFLYGTLFNPTGAKNNWIPFDVIIFIIKRKNIIVFGIIVRIRL